MAKYLTGFCNMGQCEGTKPRGHNDTPLPTCTFWQDCKCECHEQITKMYEMAGMERRPAERNPEYVPPKRTYWIPSDDPDYAMPTGAPEIDAGGVALAEKVVKVTETGRTQRGGLESWVQRECLAWLVDRDPEYGLTVRILSDEIGRIEGITPPSQGAIAAVFDRWIKYDYAVISTDRPRRFLGLTEQGQTHGLDWCRANYKKSASKGG